MKRKDFYIGLFVITISLYILGFITSPRNFGDFSSYLLQDPIIYLFFYTEAITLAIIIIYLIVREICAMIRYDSDKK
ncbi:hypothetical protein ACPWSR_00225 [Alloiococcus sp. CFN-8]|uniref:hypothetical protein n=1 Tax=Alloiococcus sp. CFN-8 TaxID=3416081 RepID=UPI003CE88BD7